MSNRARPAHLGRHPLHVVLRAGAGLPRLGRRDVMAELRKALEAGAGPQAFRLVQCSVQGNHLHLGKREKLGKIFKATSP